MLSCEGPCLIGGEISSHVMFLVCVVQLKCMSPQSPSIMDDLT